MQLFGKSKTFPLTVFQPVLWGDFAVCQYGHNAISVTQICPKIKNDRKFSGYFGKMTEMFQRK